MNSENKEIFKSCFLSRLSEEITLQCYVSFDFESRAFPDLSSEDAKLMYELVKTDIHKVLLG